MLIYLIPASDGQLVVYKRKDSSESYNQATVEFINRANGYEKETVAFEIVADVQKRFKASLQEVCTLSVH